MACTFSTSERPKVVLTPSVFYTFDLEMCFTPQRRALFPHLNCQEWSERGVLRTFWLGNVLRTTTACTFSTSQLPKLVQSWGALYILTSTCNFSSLIWPAGSAPAALVSLLFGPPEPQIIWKNTVNRDFPTFLRTCIFFLLTLSLLWSSHFLTSPLWLFPPLLFHVSILSEVWLLDFLRVIWHYQYLTITATVP